MKLAAPFLAPESSLQTVSTFTLLFRMKLLSLLPLRVPSQLLSVVTPPSSCSTANGYAVEKTFE
jgi:hypothetical protein